MLFVPPAVPVAPVVPVVDGEPVAPEVLPVVPDDVPCACTAPIASAAANVMADSATLDGFMWTLLQWMDRPNGRPRCPCNMCAMRVAFAHARAPVAKHGDGPTRDLRRR
jgi:hypothetical protein